MAVFLVMSLGGIILAVYYIFLQYYVLLIEVLLFAGLLILCVLEMVLGFFACWQFQSYEKQQ